MNITTDQRGVTIAEILLTVAVLVILLAVSGPTLQTFLEKRSLDTWTLSLQDVLRRAHSESVAGINNSTYGVRIETDHFEVFPGTTYVSNPENEIITLPNGVAVSSVALTGGGSDIIFDLNTGETAQNGTVTISYQGISSRSVSINSLGLVQITP